MAVHLNFLLILTGLTGIHSAVSVKAGASISIPCPYDPQYINQVKYLCKGIYFKSCSTIVQTETQHTSTKFSISDDKIQKVFTVTVNDLMAKDTGSYWCAVNLKAMSDVGKYFYLSVTSGTPGLYVDHQEISGFSGETITINCHGNHRGMKWCKMDSSCVTTSGSIDGTSVTITRKMDVSTVTMSGLRTESSGWYLCLKEDLQMPVHVTVTERNTTTTLATTQRLTTLSKPASPSIDLKSLSISLSLLITIVMVALFIWLMLKKNKRTQAESSATTKAEEEVVYCNVGYMRKLSSQKSYSESDVDVMYSSVVTTKENSAKRVDVEQLRGEARYRAQLQPIKTHAAHKRGNNPDSGVARLLLLSLQIPAHHETDNRYPCVG